MKCKIRKLTSLFTNTKYNSKINVFIHKTCAFSQYNREVDFVQTSPHTRFQIVVGGYGIVWLKIENTYQLRDRISFFWGGGGGGGGGGVVVGRGVEAPDKS